MHWISARLLIFFVLFTHSAIAMDIHVPHASEPVSSALLFSSDTHSLVELQDCGDLSGHCSHSSTHTSGMPSTITVPSFESPAVPIASLHLVPDTYTQSPPLRPPKT